MDTSLNYLVQVQDRANQNEQPKTVVVPREHLTAFLVATLNGTSNVCVISSVDTFSLSSDGANIR